MTSRTPKNAFYLGSPNCQFLKQFSSYLTEWEQCTKDTNGSFRPENTAEGLGVTIKSTVELLEFQTSAGFRYLLTANLSQDKLENVFGIVRQLSGTNDHPTAAQFLIPINALAFYNLARPPKSGNCSPQVISSLISGTNLQPPTQRTIDAVDSLIDGGNFSGTEAALVSCISTDHTPCVVQKSHDMLTYYIAGYVARKALRMTQCEHCGSSLTTDKSEAIRSDQASQFTVKFDNGGLLYPSGPLSAAIGLLEDSFTTYFSVNKLHEKSLVDF